MRDLFSGCAYVCTECNQHAERMQQKQTVAAIFPEAKDGNKPFNVLEAAPTELKSITVDRIPFERLDFGETEILDRFYGANAAVVDVIYRCDSD